MAGVWTVAAAVVADDLIWWDQGRGRGRVDAVRRGADGWLSFEIAGAVGPLQMREDMPVAIWQAP